MLFPSNTGLQQIIGFDYWMCRNVWMAYVRRQAGQFWPSSPVLCCWVRVSSAWWENWYEGRVTDKDTHTHTHTEASRGGMFRSSALHLFIAKYNQRNPGLPLPLLCVNSWVGQRMEEEKRRQGGKRKVGMIVKTKRTSKSLRERVERRVNLEWCGRHSR